MMKSIKTNPVLEKLERGAKLGAKLTGYKCNSKEKGTFSLATTIDAKRCYLIPEKNILHWEYIDEKEGYICVYLEEATEVEVVLRQIMYSHTPFQSSDSDSFRIPDGGFSVSSDWLTGNLFQPLLLPTRNRACELACIKRIQETPGLTFILPGGASNSANIVLSQAGRDELRRCLIDRCNYWGFILLIAFNEAVAQIEGNVTVRPDPTFPDIPSFR